MVEWLALLNFRVLLFFIACHAFLVRINIFTWKRKALRVQLSYTLQNLQQIFVIINNEVKYFSSNKPNTHSSAVDHPSI